MERNGRNSMAGIMRVRSCLLPFGLRTLVRQRQKARPTPRALHCPCVISLSRAIDGFASYVADERRFSPRTVEAYGKDLARFVAFWEREFANQPAPKTPLSRIDTLAVRSYLAHLHRDGLVEPVARPAPLDAPLLLPLGLSRGPPREEPGAGPAVAARAEGATARDDAAGHREAPFGRRERDVRARARARALRAPLRHGPARLGGGGAGSRGRRLRRAASARHRQGQPPAHRSLRRRGGRGPARIPSFARRAAPSRPRRRPRPGPSSSTPAEDG